MASRNISCKIIPVDSFLLQSEIKNRDQFKSKLKNIIYEQITKHDPRIIGFELMYTFNSSTVIEMTRYAKSIFPDKIIIVGGNHATFTTRSLLNPKKNTGIDIIVRGEGEWTTEELIKELQSDNPNLAKIKGISYRGKNGSTIDNPPRERGNLYELPPLNFSLLQLPKEIHISMFNHATMFNRGCLGNCTFCTSPKVWERNLTQKLINNLQVDINYLVKQGVKNISLWDDDLLVDNQSFQSLMTMIASIYNSNPEIKFYLQTRVERLRNDYRPEYNTNLMKQAGVKKVFLGVESGSQNILNAMRKGCKTGWIREACQNLKQNNIEVGIYIIIGHPGSNSGEEEKSLKFIESLLKDNLVDDMQCHVLSPLPGTDVIHDPRLKILDTNPEHYGIIYNYPVYELINPKTGKTTFSREQIWRCFIKCLELRQKYLGLDFTDSNKPRI